jgi:hypothetical protein
MDCVNVRTFVGRLHNKVKKNEAVSLSEVKTLIKILGAYEKMRKSIIDFSLNVASKDSKSADIIATKNLEFAKLTAKIYEDTTRVETMVSEVLNG